MKISLADNTFDWLMVLERAPLRVLLDSCFSNLVEHLGIPAPKLFKSAG